MPRLRLLPPATVVDSHEKATAVLNYLMNRGGRIAIDTETTGLDVMRDRILYWSMATEDQRYFLEYQYLYRFDPLFQRKDVSWYLANAKYDMHMFANAAVSLAGEVRDIVVMDAMIDDTRPHGLKEQNRLAYGIEWGDFKDLFLDPERVAKSLSLDKEGLKAFKALKGQEKLPFVYGNRPDIVIDYASCDAFFTESRKSKGDCAAAGSRDASTAMRYVSFTCSHISDEMISRTVRAFSRAHASDDTTEPCAFGSNARKRRTLSFVACP